MTKETDILSRVRALYPNASEDFLTSLAEEISRGIETTNPIFFLGALCNILASHSDMRATPEGEEACVVQDVVIPKEIATYFLRTAFSMQALRMGQTDHIKCNSIGVERIGALNTMTRKTEDLVKLVPRAIGLKTGKGGSFQDFHHERMKVLEAALYDHLVSQNVPRSKAWERVGRAMQSSISEGRQEKRITEGRKSIAGSRIWRRATRPLTKN